MYGSLSSARILRVYGEKAETDSHRHGRFLAVRDCTLFPTVTFARYVYIYKVYLYLYNVHLFFVFNPPADG